MSNLSAAACRAGRAILKWSVRKLAEEAKVSPNTVFLVEAGKPFQQGTAVKIVGAFERNGVEVLNGDAPGARMKAMAE